MIKDTSDMDAYELLEELDRLYINYNNALTNYLRSDTSKVVIYHEAKELVLKARNALELFRHNHRDILYNEPG